MGKQHNAAHESAELFPKTMIPNTTEYQKKLLQDQQNRKGKTFHPPDIKLPPSGKPTNGSSFERNRLKRILSKDDLLSS